MFKSKMFKTTVFMVASLLVSFSAFAGGTNVSSGISWTIGTSHTDLMEFSNYNSHGNGISVSVSHNDFGFDSLTEVYKTRTKLESKTIGEVDNEFSSVDYNSSAGIIKSYTGMQNGNSTAKMKTESSGYSETMGRYSIASVQEDSVNYEHGEFNSSSGFNARSQSRTETHYENSYSGTEFNY